MLIRVTVFTEENGKGPEKSFEAEVQKSSLRINQFPLSTEELKDFGTEEQLKNLLGKTNARTAVELAGENVRIVKLVDSVDVSCHVEETFVSFLHPFPIVPGNDYSLRLGELCLRIKAERL